MSCESVRMYVSNAPDSRPSRSIVARACETESCWKAVIVSPQARTRLRRGACEWSGDSSRAAARITETRIIHIYDSVPHAKTAARLSSKLDTPLIHHLAGNERLRELQSADLCLKVDFRIALRDFGRPRKRVQDDRTIFTLEDFDPGRFQVVLALPFERRVFLQIVTRYGLSAIQDPIWNAVDRDRVRAFVHCGRIGFARLQFRLADR